MKDLHSCAPFNRPTQRCGWVGGVTLACIQNLRALLMTEGFEDSTGRCFSELKGVCTHRSEG